MHLRRTHLAAALALLVGLTLMCSGQAWAARATVHDVRGDARPAWDIKKIVVANGRHELNIRVVFRGRLRTELPPGFQVSIGFDMGPPADSVFSGDFHVYLLLGSTDPAAPDGVHLSDSDAEPIHCPGLRGRARPRRKIVTFTVPQSCFHGQAGRVRIAGYTYHVRGTADEADYIDSWSRWIARG